MMNVRFRNALTAFAAFLAILLGTQASAQKVLPSRASAPRGADALLEVIRSAQRQNVRESWGEKASECFTDRDLLNFHNADVPKNIVQTLRQDRNFILIIQSLRGLNTDQLQEILDRAASTYKPTWAQMGKIDRRGQTEAGQLAEKEIASAITALAREML